MAEPLTDDDKQTLKTAAFGAVYLVANADPGFFKVLRESFAASGALAGATGPIREVLTEGPLPRLPKSPAEVTEVVLTALRRSMAILAEKGPDDLEDYQSIVITAMDRVAEAADGVSEKEYAMIARVKEALSG